MDTNKINTIISRAPGRTCLFGDHQDYLGLPVIACAINRYITITAEANDGEELIIFKKDLDETRTININKKITTVDKGDHLLATLKILRTYNCIPDQGYNITITGNIPINAGTSSSSAVIIAWIRFLIAAYGCNQTVTKEFVSRIAYEAEVLFDGAPGGKMDQYSIGLGNILFLETGDFLNYETFGKPLHGLIVAESGIPKETTGVLKELKDKAILAINTVKEKSPDFDIQTATKEKMESYLLHVPDHLKIYLKAAILNHDITQKARVEFKKDSLDTQKIGILMNEHHYILKEYLKITVPKIDRMIDGVIQAGALGAKIVGSGRGGSIVVLAPIGQEEKLISALIEAGAKNAYSVHVDSGAQIIEPK
ncbi:mevalonate kinase family protein [Aquimarina sediminis]|uniref:mevalonate kinase family protein n=1 Tax=Aquimarina sediminis TaxID=2070536 RepID=UPI001F4D4D19|nr:galactokinase family protein [Aquimarina sediminis]